MLHLDMLMLTCFYLQGYLGVSNSCLCFLDFTIATKQEDFMVCLQLNSIGEFVRY